MEIIKFLQQYDLTTFAIFITFSSLIIKGVITFFDWAYERLRKIYSKEFNQITEKERLQDRLQKGSQLMNSLKQNQENTDDHIQDLEKKMNVLIESDKDAIKSFITREHHYFCYKLGGIDDFSLECIEKRYLHYKDEGGNSFIDSLMEDLRRLPILDTKQMTKIMQKNTDNK